MVMGNDTRGWILTSLSAIACVVGSLVICVDLLVRLLPGKRNWRIQDSNGFLSCSLSLSAGVMLFSALYKMLPSSKDSLEKGGMAPKAAAWVLIACFLGGVFGIQVLSRICHHFMPSHVVDCDHTHDDNDEDESDDHDHEHNHAEDRRGNGRATQSEHDDSNQENGKKPQEGKQRTESTPLLNGHEGSLNQRNISEMSERQKSAYGTVPRPPIRSRVSATVSQLVSGRKSSCDGDGPCFGYSNPCGQSCFKILSRGGARHQSFLRSTPSSTFRSQLPRTDEEAPPPDPLSINTSLRPQQQPRKLSDSANMLTVPSSTTPGQRSPSRSSRNSSPHSDHSDQHTPLLPSTTEATQPGGDSQPHHHHVPTNAFLSISLQTSIAIALHKLPEGFITYATNHANPSLGFSVFLALFIHNISEGFALALPIYLATQSRLKAIALAALLGGLSQPLGAGVAASWLALAERGKGDWKPSESVYGAMFAVTAGIMASVALSLMQESVGLAHNKGLCLVWTFVGMGILGMSSALTA